MSRILLASMLVFALGVTRVGAQTGDEVRARPAEPPAQPRTTTIFRLNHLSATAVYQLMQGIVFQSNNQIQIAAEPTSNSLLISAAAADRMEIERLIAELDRPQAQVAIEVEIAQVSWFDSGKSAGETPVGNRADAELDLSQPGPELVARLRQMEQKGLVEVLNRINLSAVSNQLAMVQMGDRRAVPRGISETARAAFEQQRASGQPTRSSSSLLMTEQSMGTLLNATPRVAPDGTIALQIDLEKSFLNPRPDDAVISGETRATGTSTAVLKSTVVLRSGETAVLGGFSNSSKPGQSQLVVLVTARIVGGSNGFSKTPGEGGGHSSNSDKQFKGFAVSIIKQYDKNRDGKLQRDEWSSHMQSEPKAYDKNDDGVIEKHEFAARLKEWSGDR